MKVTEAAGGGRWVRVDPERLQAWLRGFGDRHGGADWAWGPETVIGRGADGATAECTVPFGPLAPEADQAAGSAPDAVADLVAHTLRPRRVGVVLVRLGGHAVGVFDGSTLVASKVGSRPVHGRSAAGGQSQQRFSRRRDGQARVALSAAVDTAAAVLLPVRTALDALVLGGDRLAIDTVLADPRLAPLRPLAVGGLLDVPEPRLRVLRTAPELFRAVHIRVREP